jgi:superfamily II DNA or RNA helicase
LADTPSKQTALQQLAEFVRESNGSVIFTQSVETAVAAADVLQDEDISAEAIYSADMSANRRQQLISDLADGALQALAAPKILDEGVDVPDVNLGIVMGASSSRRQMIQRLGRVIRLKPDNGIARFTILYVNDTVEDPETGARSDFMSEVEDAASRVVLMRQWDEDDLSAVWAGEAPRWVPDRETARASDPEVPSASTAVESDHLDRQPARVARPAPRERMLPRPKRPRPATDPTTVALLHQIEETRELLRLMRDDEARDRKTS